MRLVLLNLTGYVPYLRPYLRQSKLGLIHNPRYDDRGWRQLHYPENKAIAIGLWEEQYNIGTGGQATIFIIDDIERARSGLMAQGIDVTPIKQVGDTEILEAFFRDPDGNLLCIRQNPSRCPRVSDFARC